MTDLGLSQKRISIATGISRAAIRDWQRGRLSRRVSGEDSAGHCPICGDATLDPPVYAYLLGMYLGDGCISLHQRGVFHLRIALDLRYPNIIEECAEAMASFRVGQETKVGRVMAQGCIVLGAYWKHWPCVFPQHGPGMKHLRAIRLHPWQQRIVVDHPGLFARGLIHSDGWRGINRVKGYEYPRYEFKNKSADIRQLFCEACDRLGIAWRRMNTWSISVARAADVAALDRFVGPKS